MDSIFKAKEELREAICWMQDLDDIMMEKWCLEIVLQYLQNLLDQAKSSSSIYFDKMLIPFLSSLKLDVMVKDKHSIQLTHSVLSLLD